MLSPMNRFAILAALLLSQPAFAQPNADDYPAEARKNGWEGKVVFRALIGTDGRAKNCEIVQSSGHIVLDDATCIKVIDTARFDPARDANGTVIEGFIQSGFTWELEGR
jgi:TonB family protein